MSTQRALAVATQTPWKNGRGVPVLFWGHPGIGKSSAVEGAGQKLGVHVETIIASLREPSDFSGIPYPDTVTLKGSSEPMRIARMLPPSWALRAAVEPVWVFLDEISTAAPAVQAALLRVVLDKVVGELALHPHTAIIAAANPPETSAGGWELSPPLANRFMHIDSEPPTAAEWTQGMLNNWEQEALPLLDEQAWQATYARTRGMVAGFLSKRGSLLFQLPKDNSKRGRAWPSPRSHHMALHVWTTALTLYPGDDDLHHECLSGCIGGGVANELLTWVKEVDLPDPEDLLKKPDSWKPDPRADRTLAVLTAVTQASLRPHPDKNARVDSAFHIISNCMDAGHADVALTVTQSLAKNINDVSKTPTMNKVLSRLLNVMSQSGLYGG